MTISFVAASTAANVAAATTLVLSKPTGTADGDLMIACFCCDNAVSLAGWTLLRSTAFATNHKIQVLYRVAASEGSSYTFGFTSNYAAGAIVTMRGATISFNQNSGKNNASSTSVPGTAITTVENNEMVLWIAGNYFTVLPVTPTLPSALTQAFAPFAANSGTSYHGLAVAYAILASPGVTGSTYTTGGQSPAAVSGVQMLGLRTAVGTAGGVTLFWATL